MARITIIDDDTELAENTAAILQAHNHTVNTLSQTENAVAALSQDMPDLLILDVMFPEDAMGGFKLAREIRSSEETRALPVILLTGVNQHFPVGFSGDDIDPSWMPIQVFLEKPFDTDGLLKTIDDLLSRSGEPGDNAVDGSP